MHKVLRSNVEYNIPARHSSDEEFNPVEIAQQRADDRAMHLSSLGFMLRWFDLPHDGEVDSESCKFALQSFGDLINRLAEDSFRDIEELSDLAAANLPAPLSPDNIAAESFQFTETEGPSSVGGAE